jgi:lipopolysaccharide/colanic/teichoic acid biosynthesis glycosyltransferase
MDAKKISTPRLQDRLGEACQGLEFSWIENAEIYATKGLINDELLDDIVRAVAWNAYYNQKPVYNVTKLLFDRTVAALLLILCMPLFILISVAIVLTFSGPVFFSQIRIGQNLTPFRIYKFRTMRVGTKRSIFSAANEIRGGLFKVRHDIRVTRIGRILRRWSLDELPQLFNVLIGDMSLVGPRPLPPEDTSTIADEFFIRFAVKPGITGYWQATNRESTDGHLKIKLDMLYALERGWKLDLYLLCRTIPRIISGLGAW